MPVPLLPCCDHGDFHQHIYCEVNGQADAEANLARSSSYLDISTLDTALERINCGTLKVACVFDGSATNSDAGSAALLYIVDGTKWDLSYPDVCAATVRVRLCHCTAIMAEMVAFLLGHALATLVYQKWAGRVATSEVFLRDQCRNADVSIDPTFLLSHTVALAEGL